MTESIRPRLDAVDKIRGILGRDVGRLEIPTMAVIGNQSSGKSSVLERVSGIDLPRGEGTVTRCPIVLRMSRQPITKVTIESKRHVLATIDKAEVADRIRRMTDDLLAVEGMGAEFTDEPISVHVAGPHLEDLTLVDLPGIVYVMDGRADPEVLARVKAMYNTFIGMASCTILCVLPANVDPGTQQAWQFVRTIDANAAPIMLRLICDVDLAGQGGGPRGRSDRVCRHQARSRRGDSVTSE